MELFLTFFTLVILLAFSAFFSGSETALFLLKEPQLRELHSKAAYRAKIIQSLIERPRRLLILILLCNMLVNVSFSSLSAGLSFRLFGEWGPILVTIPIIIMILIFGEILPKIVAVSYPSTFSLVVSIPLNLFKYVTAPIWGFLEFIIKPLFPARASQKDRLISRQEIRWAVELSGYEGELKPEEINMIKGVLELGELTAGDIAVPRTEVTCLSVSTTPLEAADILKKDDFSQFPVYVESREEIIGQVQTTDLLNKDVLKLKSLETLLKPIQIIPSRKKLGEIFEIFQSQKERILAVVDDYGAFAGIVTWRDIMEVIFGEILSHSDEIQAQSVSIQNGRMIIPARMEIERFNELFNMNLISKKFHTMGGYIIERIERLPLENEKFLIDGILFIIHKTTKKQIIKLEVSIMDASHSKPYPGG